MKNKLFYTYLTISIIIVSIIFSLVFGIKLYYALLVSLIFTFLISLKLGNTLVSTFYMVIRGMRKATIVLIVMSIVGVLISIWMVSGTIPSMIYYGFEYLSNTNIILAAFFISSLVSMVLGTAIGTISTIGSVFLSLAYVLHVPLGPLVGAIVSGSYLGDRTSPMSSSANLLAVSTETSISNNVIELLKTAVPIYFLTSAMYWFIGKEYILTTGSSQSNIAYYKDLLSNNFDITFVTLLPPLIILISTMIFKLPIVKSLLLGLISSLIIVITSGNVSIPDLINIGIYGYNPSNHNLSAIMSGGGLLSMKAVLLVVSISTGLTGILQDLSLIDPLISKLRERVHTQSDLLISTVVTTVLVCFITCSQALTIIIPAQYLRDIYDEFKLNRRHLVRIIADTGIIIVPIVPWNLNAIMINSLLNVKPIEYVPYTYMCLLLPMTAIVYWIVTKRRSNIDEN